MEKECKRREFSIPSSINEGLQEAGIICLPSEDRVILAKGLGRKEFIFIEQPDGDWRMICICTFFNSGLAMRLTREQMRKLLSELECAVAKTLPEFWPKIRDLFISRIMRGGSDERMRGEFAPRSIYLHMGY